MGGREVSEEVVMMIRRGSVLGGFSVVIGEVLIRLRGIYVIFNLF